MSIEHMQESTQIFFNKLDKIHKDLVNFSQGIDNKRDKVFQSLENFENKSLSLGKKYMPTSKSELNVVEENLKNSIESIQKNIGVWRNQIEKNKKGTKFMIAHEKFLVVMVFGAVKSGKSSLGNFVAGKYFAKANFDNEYKHHPHPEFAMQEKGREKGDVEKDAEGKLWFKEGVTDTTGAIQYFTLSGLRWMDSPGTGALQKADDTRNMEEMVNEYIPYTDLCIFLMNSSEPGIRADLKYIQKLSREGQEAIVVITKSDINDEDEDEEGNLITQWRAKDPETRKMQENSICNSIKETYPNVPAEKYRAISVSTYLAQSAVEKQSDRLYKESNIGELLKILGNKTSDEAVRLKEKKPKKNLNSFIDSICNGEEGEFLGIDDLDRQLDGILRPIREYKNKIDKNSESISSTICLKVKAQVQQEVGNWAEEVEANGQKLDDVYMSKRITDLAWPIMQKELNKGLSRIIGNYQEQKIDMLDKVFKAGGIQKQTKTIEHEYKEYVTTSRSPSGFIENVRSLFGKTYYTITARNRKITKEVDLGTNLEEYLEKLMPELNEYVKGKVKQELLNVQTSYFKPQECYVNEMRDKLQEIKKQMQEMKFRD